MGQSRAAVIGRVVRTPLLRRLQAAFFLFAFAEDATWLATIVFAFERGGVDEVGLAAFALLIPAVLVAPFAAYAGDRFRPDRALALGHAAQAAAMLATWGAMHAGVGALTYAGAAAVAASVTFTRPVMGSLLPAVTRVPADLVAANVASKLVEQVGSFSGPVVAGLIIAATSTAEVFLVCGLGLAAAVTLVVGLDRPGTLLVTARGADAGTVAAEVLGGFVVLRQLPVVRSLVVLTSVGGLMIGISDVLTVVFVEARLGGGGDRSGLLAGALGLGSTLGAVVAGGLVGGGRTFRYLVVSCSLVAVPFTVLAATGSLAPALLVFVALGLGEGLLAVTASVLIQRHGAIGTLARVFGIAEGLQMLAIALGSFAVSALATRLPLGVSLVAAAATLGTVAAVAMIGVRRGAADEVPVDAAIVARVARDPVFEPLPVPAIERLARGAEERHVPAGSVVVAEGEIGNEYFLVTSGRLDVTIDGAPIRELGPGTSFGEIALLRDVRRTATVRALDDAVLLAIGRDDFLEAVTGHPRSFGVVSSVADRFLAGDPRESGDR